VQDYFRKTIKMSIQLLSISHKTARASLRGRFVFDSEQTKDILKQLTEPDGQQENTGIEEAVLISTCNRTELYCSGTPENQNFIRMQHVLLAAAGIEKNSETHMAALDAFRRFSDKNAIHHLFCVAAGLDSAVLGEDQILGQVRNAYFLAMESGYTKTTFHCLFQSAITAAKRMKTDTILSKSSISTAGLALKTAMECQQDLPVKNVMIIGASGKIGSIVLKDAMDFQGLNIFITARHELPHPLHGQDMRYTVIPYEKRYEYMPDMDIVISATASPHYTVMKEHFLAQNPPVKKRVFFDLAVPADIEPEMSQVPETVCYSMEDMQELARQNNAAKLEALPKAKAILSKYEEQFVKNMAFGEALPAIAALSERAQEALGQESAYSLVHKFVCQAKKNCDADEFVQFTKILNKIVEVEV
jgi:glutamyl-tRNA reductase